MAEKILSSRIVHKHDVAANWSKAANFTPRAGELIVYDIDADYTYERIKIGDGTRNVNDLPFVDDAVRAALVALINAVDDKVDAVSELVGDTAVSTQINTAVSGKADVAAGVYAVTATSDDGVAYVATVPGIDALVPGASFIMIPGRVSNSVAPTIDVNGLGAKPIRRRLSNMSTSLQNGYTVNWLTADRPFTIIYDGTTWIVEGLTKPVGADIYGPVAKAKADEDGNVITETYVTIASLRAMQPRISTVDLLSAKWMGTDSPYSQVVTIEGVTENSQVDLTPSIEQLAIFHEKDLGFVTENEDGIVTIYALGQKPENDYTMQVTITEVGV